MAGSRGVFGKYRLVADLGHGGMANVYLAVASGPAGFNKLLVIKQIRPELADDPAFVQMFLDEARLAARVNHPNVVQTLEVGEEGGTYYIAMEFLDGQPLSRIQSRSTPDMLTLSQRLRILVDALVGLHHAHELRNYDGSPLGVVHRDATPQNLFVTYDGQVKLVDFGVAKAATSSGQTSTGVIKGKLSYMAPEQARGEPVDRRADVFSVGVMFWEAVMGRRMWAGLSSEMGILHRLALGDIPTLPPEVPAELRAIGGRALAADANARYPSAAAMAEDLERYLDRQPDRGSPREIGARLGRAFASDREKIHRTVNEQLAAIELAATGAHLALPHLNIEETVDAPPPSFPDLSERSSPSSSSSSYTAKPAAATVPPPPDLSVPTSHASPSRRPLWGLGLGALAAVVFLLGAWRGLLSRHGAETPENAAPAASVRQVELKLAVLPPTARLFFDDEPLPGNPATLMRPADGRTHLLRAEAPGHLPRVRPMVIDKDYSLEMTLERDPAAAATATVSAASSDRRPPTAPAGVGAPAVPSTTEKKPTKGRRNVDSNNPYGP